MRVLVVEDAARLANWIAEGLRDQGIAVDIAYDGTEAANKLDLNPYDVVVLDRDLPGIHGDTLCRMIIDSDDPAMILMLTAASAPGERVGGLTLGADDYLPNHSTSPNSSYVFARSPAANRQPSPTCCGHAGSRSTLEPAWSTATAARSTSHPRNVLSSKHC